MNESFKFYDVSRFPLVSIEGSRLPAGYAPQWIAEMDALVARGEPFAFVLIDGVENPTHADQKAQTQWFKRNKKALAAICRGVVAVEPDRAKRLLKRAQALAITAAFGLKFSIAPGREEAERRARRLLAGETLGDDDE
jgi:hypothetical protein